MKPLPIPRWSPEETKPGGVRTRRRSNPEASCRSFVSNFVKFLFRSCPVQCLHTWASVCEAVSPSTGRRCWRHCCCHPLQRFSKDYECAAYLDTTNRTFEVSAELGPINISTGPGSTVFFISESRMHNCSGPTSNLTVAELPGSR
jgi:hypothetical protein